MAYLEREIVQRALRAAGGDEAAAAKRLGITKAALKKRL
jgi:transcriptional regulator with PAS, ATPase and Fis domain